MNKNPISYTVIITLFFMLLVMNFILERWDQRQFDQCMSIRENIE